ncbi:MAG TPA: hypothetical protein ENJ28_06020 [Gammaproteobacteria bacterium]|nr:hypothetical protein [Gammaproteobacteria bacterium]
MQPSDDKNIASSATEVQPGQTLAVVAESLFLLNLVFLPVLGFIILLGLYLRYKNKAESLARCHLRQTFNASIWAGVMLVLVNGLIILLGGYHSPYVWIIVILYLTSIHSAFIMFGTFGLTRAMNGKHYHYPIIGRKCLG